MGLFTNSTDFKIDKRSCKRHLAAHIKCVWAWVSTTNKIEHNKQQITNLYCINNNSILSLSSCSALIWTSELNLITFEDIGNLIKQREIANNVSLSSKFLCNVPSAFINQYYNYKSYFSGHWWLWRDPFGWPNERETTTNLIFFHIHVLSMLLLFYLIFSGIYFLLSLLNILLEVSCVTNKTIFWFSLSTEFHQHDRKSKFSSVLIWQAYWNSMEEL